MELDIRPKVEVHKHVGSDSKSVANSHGINLYKTPPYGQLTLEECEDLFRQRLEALSIIEKSELIESELPVIANLFRDIKSFAYKTNCIVLRTTDSAQKKLDHYSHMLTRMYCVYQPTMWEWFKTSERKLFFYRLRDKGSSLSTAQLESMLESFNFDFERVMGPELVDLHRENLVGWNRWDTDRELQDIFKVKFTDALPFIAKRSVSLKDGFAFLTRHEIIRVVCGAFERHLEHELQYARQHLNVDLFQTQQLLDSLHIVYLDFKERMEEQKRLAGQARDTDSRNPYKINPEDIPQLMKTHYPPCMRYLQEVLEKDHHLKHQARLHYGAFLRSGGVDVDSALEFWRKEFTKKIPREKFDQNYKYNIRHLYGLEGHKKALSCFSCDKIINDNPPGPTEKHGCPFRHFDDAHLRNMLTNHGLKDVDIESIFKERSDKNYKVACSRYFEYTRGDQPSEIIHNPIHFYKESRRHENRPPPIDQDGEDLEPQIEDKAAQPNTATEHNDYMDEDQFSDD